MQVWSPAETEVEIIPPTFRKSSGGRSVGGWSAADCRQTVNLTALVTAVRERAGSRYDSTGRVVCQVLADTGHFRAYA